MAKRLNFKQLAFVRHYTGSDPITGGNATKSYQAAYGSTCRQRSIQAMGSKMLHHPLVAAKLAQAESKAVREIDWNARRVLEESIRLYDRCMGDDDHAFNATAARAALELIGRNTGIGAFTEVIEVSHTHYLEQTLAKRSKLIEGRAQVASGQPALAAPPVQVNASAAVAKCSTSRGAASGLQGNGDLHGPGQGDPVPIPAPGDQAKNENRPEVKRNAIQ